MNKQLVIDDEYCEKLKGKIVSLKKEVDLLNKNLKISQTLDDILSHQRSPLDKLGLRYAGEPSRKNDNAGNNKDVRKPKNILLQYEDQYSFKDLKTLKVNLYSDIMQTSYEEVLAHDDKSLLVNKDAINDDVLTLDK